MTQGITFIFLWYTYKHWDRVCVCVCTCGGLELFFFMSPLLFTFILLSTIIQLM